MAKILIVGGGFGGVVAAESLAKGLGNEHQITLVSRSRKFLFYPALVRLAFGRGEPDDVSFDLRDAMLNRRIRFFEGEVARISTDERHVTFAHGDLVGEMPYDFIVLALGRRLATERIPGFFEYAHHTLDLDGAFKFGEALRTFRHGHIVLARDFRYRYSRRRSPSRVCLQHETKPAAQRLRLLVMKRRTRCLATRLSAKRSARQCSLAVSSSSRTFPLNASRPTG
jgi:NADPH-dependent 2,4-dienoyl-CoA reductase/sulfur reductase-like enzyme